MRSLERFFPRLFAIAGVALALLAGLCATAGAYDNRGPGSIFEGGPHRTINELAVQRFVATLDKSDPRKALVDGRRYLLRGPRIIETSPWMAAPPEEDQPLTWDQWVVEGGFTADEPELFNSFRHFYDPLSWNPDPPLTRGALMGELDRIEGVPYLTDHLVQIRTYLDKYCYTPEVRHVRDWAVWEANVKVDAKSWAIVGNPGDGRYANRYSWQAGVKYFTVAFSGVYAGKPLTQGQRDRACAMAWRSLGETMHLLADMTCIPHVRNDSHPGVSLTRMAKEKTVGLSPEDEGHPDLDPTLGVLKHDPYEHYVNDALIRKSVPDPAKLEGVSIGAIKTLHRATIPDELFDHVALFTNRNFFSADTIPFLLSSDDRLSRVHVQANDCRAYPEPLFSVMDYPLANERDWDSSKTQADERIFAAADDEDGYYWSTIWDKKVRLCHRTWLSFAGWGGRKASKGISYPCVEDQASILLPLAVAANAKLADLFVPKIEIRIDSVDLVDGRLVGEVKHTPYGAFMEQLVYNDAEPKCIIQHGARTTTLRKEVKIKQGRIEIDIRELPIQPDDMVVLEMEIAGFCIESKPSRAIGESKKEPLPKEGLKYWDETDPKNRDHDPNSHYAERYWYYDSPRPLPEDWIEYELGHVRHGKYERLSHGKVVESAEYHYGLPHNEEISHDPKSGSVISRRRHDKGRLLEETWYYGNGQVAFHVVYTGHRREADGRIDLADGTYEDFFESGQAWTSGKLANAEVGVDVKVYRYERIGMNVGGKTGQWVQRFEDASVRITSAFKDNSPIGPWVEYAKPGILRRTGQHNDGGRQVGKWYFYDDDGKKDRYEVYGENGDRIDSGYAKDEQ